MNPITRIVLVLFFVAAVGIGIWLFLKKKGSSTTSTTSQANADSPSTSLLSRIVEKISPGSTKDVVTKPDTITPTVTVKDTPTVFTPDTNPPITTPDPEPPTTPDPIPPKPTKTPTTTPTQTDDTTIYYSPFFDALDYTDLIGKLFYLHITTPVVIAEEQLEIDDYQGNRWYVNSTGIRMASDNDGYPITYTEKGKVVRYKGGIRPPAFRYNTALSQAQLSALSNDELLERINQTSYSKGFGWALQTTDMDAYNTLFKRLRLSNATGYLDSDGVTFFLTYYYIDSV